MWLIIALCAAIIIAVIVVSDLCGLVDDYRNRKG